MSPARLLKDLCSWKRRGERAARRGTAAGWGITTAVFGNCSGKFPASGRGAEPRGAVPAPAPAAPCPVRAYVPCTWRGGRRPHFLRRFSARNKPHPARTPQRGVSGSGGDRPRPRCQRRAPGGGRAPRRPRAAPGTGRFRPRRSRAGKGWMVHPGCPVRGWQGLHVSPTVSCKGAARFVALKEGTGGAGRMPWGTKTAAAKVSFHASVAKPPTIQAFPFGDN